MKIKNLTLVVSVLILSGCSSVKVQYIPDELDVPVPHVNGKPYPMTDAERKKIAEAFLDKYCI